MTRTEVLKTLPAAENAAFALDALLHLLEIASWQLCSSLQVGKPAEKGDVELIATIDRAIEVARQQHSVALAAVTAAAFEFREEASHDL